MLRKIFSVAIIILIISLAGVFIFSHSSADFEGTFRKSKIFVKKIAKKASSIIYREATIHNPSGDVVPDKIDDGIKKEVKEIF